MQVKYFKHKIDYYLDFERIDLMALRKYIFKEGIPKDCPFRPIIWKLLLGYYTPYKNDWKRIDENCFNQYQKYVSSIYPNTPSEILNEMCQSKDIPCDSNHNTFQFNNKPFVMNDVERKRLQIIDKDIARTNILIPFNKKNPYRHDLAYRRILFILSLVNGGVGYVQGMNNLCNVFYLVFALNSNEPDYEMIEAETFGCLALLTDVLRDWFIAENDDTPTGINAAMKVVENTLFKSNKDIFNHLQTMNIGSCLYLFRWLTLLCCMEFSYAQTIRYWDFIFIDLNELHLLEALCIGILLTLKKQIIGKDFSSTLFLLQHLPILSRKKVMKKTHSVLKNVLHYRLRPMSIPLNSTSFLRANLRAFKHSESIQSNEYSTKYSSSSQTNEESPSAVLFSPPLNTQQTESLIAFKKRKPENSYKRRPINFKQMLVANDV
ncbi:Rab-GAP TBC domain-containing protein [Entamoeba marina]